MAKKGKSRRRSRSRVYWRQRTGGLFAYADFRDYADVGGTLEATATSCATVATAAGRSSASWAALVSQP